MVVDDSVVIRGLISRWIAAEPDLEVAASLRTGLEAVNQLDRIRPDVAVLDVRLPDGSGVEVCRDLRAADPDLKCMMLTSFDDDEALLDAIVAGASAYLLKEVRAADLVASVRRIAAGESLLDAHATARVIDRLRNPPPEDQRLAALSPQERRILGLLAEGMTNRQIA